MTGTGSTAPITPRFEKPPVAELVLGVQFNPLVSLNTVQVSAWRDRIKAEFPIIQEHPELPDLVEVPELQVMKVRMQMVEGVPPRRFWFVNGAETELIQIQRNRFVYNWRKRADGDQYPTYDVLRKKLEVQLKAFLEFAAAERMGDFVPNLCEVTYMNHIVGSGVWTTHGEASKVFSALSGGQAGSFLPKAESMTFAGTFQIPLAGDRFGRLRVHSEPSFFIADKTPLFRMSVSSRVPALSPDFPGVLGAMDVGHVWGTCGFAALTTAEMHKVWERTR